MISVAIVTADRALRTAWHAAVDPMPDAYCAGAFATVATVAQSANGPPLQLLLLGPLPREDGLALFERARAAWPDQRILILAPGLPDEQFFALLRAGAAGFVTGRCDPARVQSAIRQLSAGETPLCKDARRRIVASFRARPGDDNLSEREREVYELLCRGKNYGEIAESLFVSKNTVRFHLKNIYKKLGVSSRHEAVARAYARGGR